MPLEASRTRIALFVLALLVLAGLFAALSHWYGMPRALKKMRHEGATFFTADPEFARGLARAGKGVSIPFFRVANPKPEGLRRIVLLGGPVASGFPMSSHHLGRIVEARWHSRFPGQPIELVNLPAGASDPGPGGELAAAALAIDPDLIVVCMEGPWTSGNETGLRGLVHHATECGAQVLLVLPPSGGPLSDDGSRVLGVKVAADSGASVVLIDADRRLRGRDSGLAGDGEFFLTDQHLAFPGRVALAELVVDGVAALWGLEPLDESHSAVAAWWRRFPRAEEEARRDTLFTGYDEHDMWSLAMRSETDPDRAAALQKKVNDLRRRAVLGWDTTAIIVAYERAQLQNAADPLTHFTAGRLLGLRGEGSRAEEAFRRGFDLQPEYPNARLNHAAMQTTRGDTEAARASLGILEKFDPQAEGLLKLQAAVAVREAELPEAAALLEKHLARTPGDSEAWLTLSEIQLKLGDFAAAEASRQKGEVAVHE